MQIFSKFTSFILLGLFIVSTSISAETYNNEEKRFSIEFDEDWQETHDISPTVKFSLVSVKRASSGRPAARFRIKISTLDKKIPLKKYIKNNIKTASAVWSILEENNKPGLGEENQLLKMERKIGLMKKQVQKLVVKAHGNVYEISCSVSNNADEALKQECAELLNSFKLMP